MMKETGLVLLFLCVHLGHVLSLTCYSGPQGNVANCMANDTVNNQTCITITLGEVTGFYCGDCTVLSNQSRFNSYACCDSDLCQNGTAEPPPSTACYLQKDSANCTVDPDCFWCDGSVLGAGMCLSTAQTGLPCWALSGSFPWNTMCAAVACPYVEPYTVGSVLYNLTVLLARGLPPLGSTAVATGLDLMSRELLFTFNASRQFNCITSDLLLQKCGANHSGKWAKYCVMSEVWPQPDMAGWLANTTLATATYMRTSGVFGSCICACHMSNYSVFVTMNPGLGPNFDGSCPLESFQLSLYVLLIVLFILVLIWNLYDLTILIVFLKRKDIITNSFKVKFIAVLFLVVKIADLACQVGIDPSAYYSKRQAFGLLQIISIIFLGFCYGLSVFTFAEVILHNAFHISVTEKRNLTVFKWVFGAIIVFCAIVNLILIAVASYFLYLSYGDTKMLSATIRSIQANYVYTYNISQGNNILLIVISSFVFGVSVLLLSRVSYVLHGTTSMDSEIRKYAKMVIVRAILMIFSAIAYIPYLAMLITLLYFVLWAPLTNPYETEYEDYMDRNWVLLGFGFTELITITVISLCWKVNVAKTRMTRYFTSCFVALSSSPPEDVGPSIDVTATGDSGTGEFADQTTQTHTR